MNKAPCRKTRCFKFCLEGGDDMNSLESISTKQLVDELCTRAGIKTEIAEPYQDMTVSVNGPAIVIVITD